MAAGFAPVKRSSRIFNQFQIRAGKKSNALKELCVHECVYMLCMFVYECVCLCMHAEARSGIKCPMSLIPRSFEAGSLPEPLSPARLKASKPQKVFCFSCLQTWVPGMHGAPAWYVDVGSSHDCTARASDC